MRSLCIRCEGWGKWLRRCAGLAIALLAMHAGGARAAGCDGEPACGGSCSPAVHPLAAGADHSCEDHRGCDHSTETLFNINLSHADLREADFSSAQLLLADLSGADLSCRDDEDPCGPDNPGANFRYSLLPGADLTGANVAFAYFDDASLSGVDFTGSVGLTDSQLRSAFGVQSIILAGLDLSGWDLSGLDLSSANLSGADLTGATLTGANLVSADLSSADLTGSVGLVNAHLLGATDVTGIILAGLDLSGWNLSGLDLTGADLTGATLTGATLTEADLSGADLTASVGLTGSQLQAAASVAGIILAGLDLSGWDLSGLDLSSADLSGADLSGSVLSGATLTDADLSGSVGLTDSQLQAAASVAGIILAGLDLSGWDLSGLDLSNADLSGADLSGSVLSGATLTDADLTGSVGLTDSQLRAAVSIEGIILAGLDLSGWNLSVLNLSGVDLRNANLAGANLSLSALIAADLRGADLRGANLYGAFWLNTDVRGADFGGADLSGSPSLINAIAGYTFYDSATHFDPGFDPVAAGWTLFGLLWEQKISDTQGGFSGVLDNSDWFGESVAALGDLDGDGVGDLAVASAWDDDGGDARGAVWVLFLDTDGTVKAHQKISNTEGGFSGVLDDSDWFGGSVAALGDLDGDGVGDLAVGAQGDDDGGVNRGAVWVLFLDSDGTVKAHQKISTTQGGFGGVIDDADWFGGSVAALGDLDCDGVGDLAVGATGDDDGGSYRGAVWVLFLDSDGTVKAHQKISNTQGEFTGVLDGYDYFGGSVAALGDLDGDGVGDLAVGAEGDDDGDADRGAVWVLFLDTGGTVKAYQKISDTQGGFNGVLDDSDWFGGSVAALGDLDGDGVGDLAAGARGDDGGDTDRGAVWVLFLDTGGTVKAHRKISDTEGGFTGVLDNYDGFGVSVVALGDLDGDGVGELAVGAWRDDDGGANRGAAWILGVAAAPIACGNSVLDPLEQCDDGGSVDGDGCSAVCEIEDRVELFGQAQGGTVGFTINQVVVSVVTTPGQTAAQVIANLAAAVGADPTLAALGTTALAIGNALVTNGTVNGVIDTDAGLSWAPPGTVFWEQKISDTVGSFSGVLDDSDGFGWSVAALGDLDGDGVGDLAVGSAWDDDGGANRGGLWVLFLDTDGTVQAHQKISDTEGGFSGVLDDGDLFGWSVAALGDLDGDGVGDLVVGAYGDDDGGANRGALWVLFLDTDGTVQAHQKISATEGGFSGVLDDADSFGWSVAALGDLDGDGVGDLAVGATGDDDGGAARGALWVLFLDADGTVQAHQKISDTEGGFTGVLDDGDSFGGSLAALGDLDGDGVGDLAVGATGDDDGGNARGGVWLLFLDTDGTVQAHQKISDTEGGFSGALDDSDWFGVSLAALGDVDGDGVGDLAVGVYGDDDGGANRGALWVLFLDTDGTVQAHQKISDTEGGFTGVLDDEDGFAWSLAALGDLDGDGVGDLAVGAPADDDGGTDRGAAWILGLDAVPIVCGDAVLDPLEECDDGGTGDGDGCSAVCELENHVELFGTAQGGRVEVTIDQVVVGVDTTAGQTAAQVIAALAAAVNANPTLAALGTTALAIDNVLVTNGTVSDVTTTDPGFGGLPVPALQPSLQLACALLLLTIGMLALRRNAGGGTGRQAGGLASSVKDGG